MFALEEAGVGYDLRERELPAKDSNPQPLNLRLNLSSSATRVISIHTNNRDCCRLLIDVPELHVSTFNEKFTLENVCGLLWRSESTVDEVSIVIPAVLWRMFGIGKRCTVYSQKNAQTFLSMIFSYRNA